MSLVDGSQTAYGLQEKPHDRGRSPPGPEDNYTSGAAISSTNACPGNISFKIELSFVMIAKTF